MTFGQSVEMKTLVRKLTSVSDPKGLHRGRGECDDDEREVSGELHCEWRFDCWMRLLLVDEVEEGIASVFIRGETPTYWDRMVFVRLTPGLKHPEAAHAQKWGWTYTL